MMDKIRLVQDAHDKLAVRIGRDALEMQIRRHFRWRKGDMIKRLYKESTVSFDRFIESLYNKGYKEGQ